MKTIYLKLIAMLLFTVTTTINAQNSTTTTTTTTTIPIREDIIPQAIKDALDTEFPNYKIMQYAGIPRENADDEFIEESDGGIIDEFEAITVTLKGVESELLATYNFKGKLKTVFSSKPNKDIPEDIMLEVNKAYPGWIVINYYRHLFGNTITNYAVIKKGDDTITLFTDEFGNFVKL